MKKTIPVINKKQMDLLLRMHGTESERELLNILKNEIIKNDYCSMADIIFWTKEGDRVINIDKRKTITNTSLPGDRIFEKKNLNEPEKISCYRAFKEQEILVVLYKCNVVKEESKLDFSVILNFFLVQLRTVNKINFYRNSSILDNITGLFNQEYLKNYIENEIERSKRYNNSFSIVFFDLDNLKKINEKYGHLVGTEILKEIAAILRKGLRKVDIVSRFGGDEFVIVLVNSDQNSSINVCERLKQQITNHTFLTKKNLNLKICGSFGISSFPDNGADTEELIQKADLAMYEVKGSGKNGIKTYEGDD
jgi:diguanylate cyclase (GGDEF)-like protein